MTSSIPVDLSPMLKEAAELKIEELNRAKEEFKSRYYNNPILAAENDIIKRVTALLDKIKKMDPFLEDDDDLETLTRYIEQAKTDRSVSHATLSKFEQQLLRKLEVHTHRMEVSSLHIDLLKEAMISYDTDDSVSAKLEKATLDDEFELVENGLEDAFDKFEKNTFAVKEIDVEGITKYLDSFFEGSDKDVLERLREDLDEYGNDVINGREEVDEDTLLWCIEDLLQNRQLSKEKKKTLAGYLQSPAAIRELKSMINSKSIRHWNWRRNEKGLQVSGCQNVDGTYFITVDEDIVDMLFLHTLAIGWSMRLKECLKDVISAWSPNDILSHEELDKREYYLLVSRYKRAPLPKPSVCNVCHPPPPIIPTGPPPPPVAYPPPPPPPPGLRRLKQKKRAPQVQIFGGSHLNTARFRNYIRDFFLSRLPNRNGSSPLLTPANEIQEKLIKTLAAELRLREAFDNEAYSVTANFKSFASSLPHQTILAVLKFIGMPQPCLNVFTRFLGAPLNMGLVVRGTPDQVHTRTCGIPVAHGLEVFFGEAILFFLDLAVRKKFGSLMYRLRDQCYFVGTAEQSGEVKEQIRLFADTMGLNVSIGSLKDSSIGFVNFSTEGGQPMSINVDSRKVDSYARRVKKQLSSSTTVLEWIRTWNTSIGKYASHLFGPLANVFGKPHLDAVKVAHNRMIDIIFEGGNLTDHITSLIQSHLDLDLSNPSLALEPLIFLPTAYGGLGVKNPFITLNLARTVHADPTEELQRYLKLEDKYYARAVALFNDQQPGVRESKLKEIFNSDPARIAAALSPHDANTFPPQSEITAHRERIPYPILQYLPWPAPIPRDEPTPSLVATYNAMLAEPFDPIETSDRVGDEVTSLAGRNGMKRWFSLSGEERWVLQMYGEECFEKYGGLEVWHPDSVPLEALRRVRGEWDDFEDDVSSVTEA